MSSIFTNLQTLGTLVTTFTWTGTGGGTSASATLQLVKIGRHMMVRIPDAVVATTGTSSVHFDSDSTLPAWARPSVVILIPVIAQQAGTAVTTALVKILTTGTIQLFKDSANSNWTNATAHSGFAEASQFNINAGGAILTYTLV